MKLASLKGGGRDGTLVLVSDDHQKVLKVDDIAVTMQYALENWDEVKASLNLAQQALNEGKREDAFTVPISEFASPLPRSYQFLDGSAYLAHVERVRKARGAEMPPSFLTDPLMYQAASDGFLAPTDPVVVADQASGIDFEAEVAVVTGDVPMGVSAKDAEQYILLVMILNDVSLRNLIPAELSKGFGFMASKPRSACAPIALTIDELGDNWQQGKLCLPMRSFLNGERFGEPEAGEDMQFSFPELIAHAAQTRPLAAGTIIGSGTVANQDESKGASCLAEKRVLEVIKDGKAITPFLQFGDTVKIEMLDRDGNNLFGTIEQTIKGA